MVGCSKFFSRNDSKYSIPLRSETSPFSKVLLGLCLKEISIPK